MKRFILVITTVALAALSCNETPTGPVTNPPPEMASPRNVLRNVEISFNNRNSEVLKGALSRNFVFYFDPDDVGQSPPGKTYEIPESWTYTEFTGAVGNMFNNAYTISLDISEGVVGAPGEGETTYKAENVKINLLVMIDDLNGFRAGDFGYCNYEFERYDGEGGQKLWRLTNWWDRTAAPAAFAGATPTSFGTVLALYR